MKFLGLTVFCLLATLASAALFGAANASATELCPDSVYPCDEPYATGTKIEAKLEKGTEAVLAGTITVKCKTSTIVAKTLQTEGSPLKAEVTSMTFGECTGCTSAATSVPWEATIAETESGDGNGTFSFKKPEVTLKGCQFGTSCTAKASELQLDVVGGEPARVQAKEDKFELSGFLCGSSGSFTASYEVNQPPRMQVGPRPTSLCAESIFVCPAAKRYPKETPLEGTSGNTQFEGFPGTKTCKSSVLEFETGTTSIGQPLLGKTVAIEFSMGCGGCGVTTVPNPAQYTLKFRTRAGGDGIVSVEAPKFRFTCSLEECTYEKLTATLDVIGGAVAHISAVEEELDKGAVCDAGFPAAIKWTGVWGLSSPSPMYMAR